MAKKKDVNVTENEVSEEKVETETVENNKPEENNEEVNQDEKVSEEKTEEGDVAEKEEKKDKKDILIEELNDKYMRTFAEFDNFRKRSEKEKSAMFEVGAKSIIEKILPIVDSFERGLATLSDEEKTAPFADGMDKVYKQLMTELEAAGVKPIECIGKEFDPEYHNAVMQVESEEFESGIVAQELLKGYTYRDSVVRYSMVKVAN